MKLKVTLHRPNGAPSVDIVVSADPNTSVGELARSIAAADPQPEVRPEGRLTLRVLDGAHDRVVPPALPLARSGVRSGAAVAVVDAPSAGPASAAAPAAALLVVESGPDTGRTFPLRPGANYVGRGAGNDVSLSDRLVSKNHARIDVADVIEIVDRGSVNGVIVRDVQVPSAVLQPDDRVLLGDTEVRVVPQSPGDAARGATVEHNRSPRLDPIYEGETHLAPEPPSPPGASPLPFVALLAPIVFGIVLYAITRNATTVLFVALSPLLMIGNVLEQRVFAKRSHTKAVAQFRDRLGALDAALAAAAPREVAGRCAEHPSGREVFDAARTLDPLLWTRRPDRHGFLTVRLGLGRLPSRAVIDVPETRNAVPALVDELTTVTTRWGHVDGVPVAVDLAGAGAIGVAGPRAQAVAVARGYVVQLTGTHSPAEMVLCSLASTRTAADWAWLRWLPHTDSPHSPLRGSLADSTASATALLAELEELIDARAASARDDDDPPIVPAIVVLVENDAPVERSRVVALAEAGPPHGVAVLWVASAANQLPAACTTFVTIDPTAGVGAVGLVDDGRAIVPVTLEPVDAAQAETFARVLAPVVDSGARIDDAAGVPRSVSLLALLDTTLARDPQAVIDRWHQSFSLPGTTRPPDESFDRGLRAIVGQSAQQELTLDLRAQGPHALVGGTTGSGKSEFLQSWVVGLAMSYSPARVTFLFVDYKGGSAFRDCVDLPHCVGLVTDLTPHLVRRALVSLNAELHHRERLLERKRAKDLLELERRGDPDAPPSLVIVVDEFAALVNEMPEFVDGMVNIAQRGRSLGLHLILATQRPAGVIKDNLRANTNLRVALRMADEDDSDNVVGSPVASTFDPDIPGRAVVRSGPGRVQTFQSGYVGGWTPDEKPPPEITVEELRFGPPLLWPPRGDAAAAHPGAKGPNDLRRLVDSAGAAFRSTGLDTPRRPWLKELADSYDLARMRPTRTDDELFFGVLDDPERQAQHEVAFVPDRDGNMAIIGTGGSGKTTVLRTLAVAAGLTTRGGPCHVYALDFGARGLQLLEPLPHVGAVIPGDDHERLTRLLRFVRDTIDERAARYAASNAGTISEYRRLAGAPLEPRLLVLIDNFAAFRTAYEAGDRFRWLDMVNGIATDGRQVGVHVIVAADRVNAIPSSLASAIQRRLVLRLANEQDYAMADVRVDALSGAPAGRGLYDGDEVQVAVLGGSSNTEIQARAIQRLAAELQRTVDRPPASPVERLPDRVELATLPRLVDGQPALGVADDTLAPVGFRTDGPLLVFGPRGSGRTSTLAMLTESFLRTAPGAHTVLIGSHRSPLWSLPSWAERAEGVDAAASIAQRLADDVNAGRHRSGELMIAIDNIGDLLDNYADPALLELVRACTAHAVLLVVDVETSAASSYSPVLQAIRSQRHGIALQPEQHDGEQVLKTAFPKIGRNELPPGRGFYVARTRALKVQVALPGAGE